jgi:NAD(P)-dependent dehydrogenase (short-subunit alcohol dehydrogenase family)
MLKGKVAIVTGGGRGLGREHALLLAEHGAKIIVNDLGGATDGTGKSSLPADDVVKEIQKMGGEAAPNYESVASFQGAKRIIDQAVSTFGKLDILVNNAGILRVGPIYDAKEEDFDTLVAVHLKGTFNCTRHSTKYWKEEAEAGKLVAGRIINTTSDAGLLGLANHSLYGAAKAGIASLTITTAMEMSRYGVTANGILPIASTRLAGVEIAASSEILTSGGKIVGGTMGRGGYSALAPEMLSPLVVYLGSDAAAEVTGQVFRVVGGKLWLMYGWRSSEVVKRIPLGKWEPEELDSKIKELIAKAPKREDMTEMLASAFS